MSAWYSIAQQRVMTTWNKETTTILVQKTRRSEIVREATNCMLNCRDFFYLKDFVGSIGVMLFKFRLLRSPDIFWNHASWSQKEEISRSTLSTSTSALDSLVVEVSELRRFYNNFMRPALVVFCPLTSLAGLVSSSSFNHSSWLQCDPRSLRAKDLVRGWTCGSKMGKNFSCVFVLT